MNAPDRPGGRAQLAITPSAVSALTVAAANMRLRWSNTAGISPTGVASPIPPKAQAVQRDRKAGDDQATTDDRYIVSNIHARNDSGRDWGWGNSATPLRFPAGLACAGASDFRPVPAIAGAPLECASACPGNSHEHTPKTPRRALLLLALLMVATRLNTSRRCRRLLGSVLHRRAFYLRGWDRWAFRR